MKIHQAGALQGNAGLGDQPLQEGQVTPVVAAGITTDGERTCYSGLGDEGHDDPAPVAVGLGIQTSIAEHGAESVGEQQGAASARDFEQGTPVVSPARPVLGKVAALAFGVEEREGDLAGRQALLDATDQRVDHRGAPKGAGQLLAERRHLQQQRESSV